MRLSKWLLLWFTSIIVSLAPSYAYATWERITSPVTSEVYGLARLGSDLYMASESGVFRRADGQEKWVALTFYKVGGRCPILHMADEALYAVCTQGIYCLDPITKQWQPRNSGLERAPQDEPIMSDSVYDVNALFYADKTLYAATWSGIFRLPSNATRWKKMGASLYDASTLTSLKHDLYAGRMGGADVCGAYQLSVGSKEWQNISTTLGCQPATGMASDGERLYMSGYSSVYRWEPVKKSWHSFEAGLPKDSSSLSRLAIYNGNLFVADSEGVYSLSVKKADRWQALLRGPSHSSSFKDYSDEITALSIIQGQLYVGTSKGYIYRLRLQQ